MDRATRSQHDPVWRGEGGHRGLGFLGVGQSTQTQGSSPQAHLAAGSTYHSGVPGVGPQPLGSRACPCQVPPFTVIGAQTPSQLLQSLPFPFCFWFFWVLRDGSVSSWRAGSQPLSPSFCLSPTAPPPLQHPAQWRGRAGGGPIPAGAWGGGVSWELPRAPGCCGAVRMSEKGAVCLALGVPGNGLFA